MMPQGQPTHLPAMSTITSRLALALVLGTSLGALEASVLADAPTGLRAFVVANGGTTSASREAATNAPPRFLLQATIGQADAAPLLRSSTGRFTLQPGFWQSIAIVQGPGAPMLSIRRGRNNTVILSWPLASTGFWLEETPSPGNSPWTRTAGSVVNTVTEHTFTVPAAGGFRCFRLRAEPETP